jgi:hypothetical protein
MPGLRRPIRRTGRAPYPYQEKVAAALWNRRNVILRAPTGSGKTLAVEPLSNASVNQKPLAKASPENVGGSGARWRSRAETCTGRSLRERGFFPRVLATSRTAAMKGASATVNPKSVVKSSPENAR